MNADWFAGRLRDLREQTGLTQMQLAANAGLTKDAVARLERGARSPVWETVVALCKALNVTADAFLQEPSTRPDAKRGRPRKASADAETTETATATKPKTPKRSGKGQGQRKRTAKEV